MSTEETAPEGAPLAESRTKALVAAQKRIGETLAGRYRVEELIGTGGMGSVYVAVQEPLGRKVALKCIRSVLTDDELAVKRFIQEARAISQLQHPNIVTLHDFGQDDDGTLFIAMELLRGESLRQRIERDGPLAPSESVVVIRDIARALAHAHAAGIVHRDLKPDNVMLSELVGHGRSVKVVDFGVAKLAQTEKGEAALTGTGHVVGTPGYIAPEQMNGVLDDPRSDLYALGVVWFEALTGASPFDGDTPMKKAFQHLTEPPPRPSARRPGVPPACEDLILRLLEKKPEERPPSAAALLELLEHIDASGGTHLTHTPGALSPSAPTVETSLVPQESGSGEGAVDGYVDELSPRPPPPFALTLAGLAALGLVLGALVGYLIASGA